MKNCFEFNLLSLTKFITVMGVFEVIEVLHHFNVVTGVITLDEACVKTKDISRMKHAAIRKPLGLSIMTTGAVIRLLVNIITKPGSPQTAYQINSALKTLDIKKNQSSHKFYEMMGEAMTRRLLFTKLAQIYAPLIQEYETNKEVLIMLINNKLLDISHVQELNGDMTKLAHYTIHNVNTYRKLIRFNQIISRCCMDTNLIELMFEITLDLESYQMDKLEDQLKKDMTENACLLY